MTSTDTDKTSIAVINTNVGYIQRDISEIKVSLKDVYATKDSLAEIAKQTEARLIRLESNSNLWKWLAPTLSAIIAVIIEYLFINYLMHIH